MAGGECGHLQCTVCTAGEKSGAMLAAIVRRNLDLSLHKDTHRRLCQSLRCLRTVRLDREDISQLSNLEAIEEAHSLYLQENQIKKIENLEAVKNLHFLTLSGNKIEKIENLYSLQKLQFLDLSNNLIQRLDVGELPQTLLILHLSGNPCTKVKGYRAQVVEALPALQELDGETVRDSDTQKSVKEDESDSEDRDTSLPLEDSADRLSTVGQDVLQRSYQRRNRALREHEDRLAELSSSDGQDSLSTQKWLCHVELSGLPSSNIEDMWSQDNTSFQRQLHNSSKDPQNASLLEKNTRNLHNNDTSSLPCKNRKAVSPIKGGGGRVSTERRSQLELKTTSCKALPSPYAQIKHQHTSKVSAGKIQGTAPAMQHDKQLILSPSHPKLRTAPTKKPLQTPEKPSARSATSCPSERQAVSVSSSGKLQMASMKRNQTSLKSVPPK